MPPKISKIYKESIQLLRPHLESGGAHIAKTPVPHAFFPLIEGKAGALGITLTHSEFVSSTPCFSSDFQSVSSLEERGRTVLPKESRFCITIISASIKEDSDNKLGRKLLYQGGLETRYEQVKSLKMAEFEWKRRILESWKKKEEFFLLYQDEGGKVNISIDDEVRLGQVLGKDGYDIMFSELQLLKTFPKEHLGLIDEIQAIEDKYGLRHTSEIFEKIHI